jgi:hypothetical protein
MKWAFASAHRPFPVLAGGVLIALVVSVGGAALRSQPVNRSNSSTRESSIVAEVEKITDSLLHFLDGGVVGRGEKNTARAGVFESSHRRRLARGEAELP